MPLHQPPSAAQIVERLGDPVFVIEAGGDDPAERSVIYANAAARRLFRIAGDRAPLATVFRKPQLLEAVEEAFAGKPSEAVYETAGAQPRWWRGCVQSLDPEGGERRVLLTLRDETDARRNERMRADFLANASHELRTPLASLVGFIETLRGHARDDEAARDKFLAIMAAQGARMSRLIDDLLSLSRIEMNEHIAPEGKVDVAAAVSDMVGAAQPLLAARKVRVDARLIEDVRARGDRDQIAQVLQNLFDNAVKYSPPGGVVTVEVSTAGSFEEASAPRRPDEPRLALLTPDRIDAGFVVIRVIDQGPGIARTNLSRLSERFYRVEGQKSGEREGTGLGLAIVKHIVNRHRGGLAVASIEGEGSVFTVCLPRAAQS
jgi:two-component system phosphate regulon sensor histidine kinase PhoR